MERQTLGHFDQNLREFVRHVHHDNMSTVQFEQLPGWILFKAIEVGSEVGVFVRSCPDIGLLRHPLECARKMNRLQRRANRLRGCERFYPGLVSRIDIVAILGTRRSRDFSCRFGCKNGFFYSIADNGSSASLNWSYEAADAIDSSPVFGPEGNLYFVSRDGYLRAVDPSAGIEYWDAAVGDVFYSTPVVDSTGKVYLAAYTGSGNNVVSVYESNGALSWTTTSASITVGGVVDSSLTLTTNGYLLFGSFDDKLYAINMGNSMADSDWPKFHRNLAADGRWPSYCVDANASPSEGGSVTGGGTHNEGAEVTLTAVPSTEYDFSSWSGDANGTSASYTIDSLIANKAVTANFTLKQYVLSITAGTGGAVSGAGTYDHGSTISITATPDTGYYFTGWTGGTVADSSSASTTITLTQAESLTANFALNEYLLVVTSGTGGSATGDGIDPLEPAEISGATCVDRGVARRWPSGDRARPA